jgi:hypothetical protein
MFSDIMTQIEIGILEYLGHVIRIEDIRAPKKIFKTKPEDRCGVGRPKSRWLDDLEAR